ncbi:MAG: VTT domain-containing protein, partial [Nitrososphaerales archaeon]
AAIAMLLARYAGRPVVERLVSPSLLARVDRFAAGKGLGFFFLFFLIPGLPDDLLCFVTGLTTLPLRIMLPMAAIARLPGLIAAVWLGASAERIPPGVWIALSILGGVILLLFWRYGDQLQEFLVRRLGGNEQHG